MNIFVVRNAAQKILFEQELVGQISDGMWENVPGDHWQCWSDATVVVAATLPSGEQAPVGRNFYAQKSNYRFNSTDLLSCVGDRMLASVQAELGSWYTLADMRADLRDLSKCAKSTLPAGGVPVIEVPVAAAPQQSEVWGGS